MKNIRVVFILKIFRFSIYLNRRVTLTLLGALGGLCSVIMTFPWYPHAYISCSFMC